MGGVEGFAPPACRHILWGPMRVPSHANGDAGFARAPLLGLVRVGGPATPATTPDTPLNDWTVRFDFVF